MKFVIQAMDETHHFPRQIVFGEVDVTQGGRVDRNTFDELVVAMLDWKNKICLSWRNFLRSLLPPT